MTKQSTVSLDKMKIDFEKIVGIHARDSFASQTLSIRHRTFAPYRELCKKLDMHYFAPVQEFIEMFVKHYEDDRKYLEEKIDVEEVVDDNVNDHLVSSLSIELKLFLPYYETCKRLHVDASAPIVEFLKMFVRYFTANPQRLTELLAKHDMEIEKQKNWLKDRDDKDRGSSGDKQAEPPKPRPQMFLKKEEKTVLNQIIEQSFPRGDNGKYRKYFDKAKSNEEVLEIIRDATIIEHEEEQGRNADWRVEESIFRLKLDPVRSQLLLDHLFKAISEESNGDIAETIQKWFDDNDYTEEYWKKDFNTSMEEGTKLLTKWRDALLAMIKA
ncbi:MAG TPA: hypothetical protein PLV42_00650 [bacterium]|nr:hypothetical protein [bacterium]